MMDTTKVINENTIFDEIKQACQNVGIYGTTKFTYHKLYDVLKDTKNGLDMYAIIRSFIRPVITAKVPNGMTFDDMFEVLHQCWSNKIINYQDANFQVPQKNHQAQIDVILNHQAIQNAFVQSEMQYMNQPWSQVLPTKGHRYIDVATKLLNQYFGSMGMNVYQERACQKLLGKLRSVLAYTTKDSFENVQTYMQTKLNTADDKESFLKGHDYRDEFAYVISELLIADEKRTLTANNQRSYIMSLDVRPDRYNPAKPLNLADLNLAGLSQLIKHEFGTQPDVIEAFVSPVDDYRAYLVITTRQKFDNKELSHLILTNLGLVRKHYQPEHTKDWFLSTNLQGDDYPISHDASVNEDNQCLTLEP